MKINRVFLSAALALSLAACGTSTEEVQTAADVPQAEVSETMSGQTETEVATTTEETTTSAETTTSTEETTATVHETEKVCTCESDFQHACCEYLNELDFLAGGIYYGDINGDDKPEAVIAINQFGFTHVLYENEKGVQALELETTGDSGGTWYISDTKQILFRPFLGHTWGTWGYEEYYIFDWNGSDYEVTSSVLRQSGIYYEDEDGEHSEYGQAYIDGKEVDNDTFEAKLEEIYKLMDENDYFPIAYIFDRNFRPNPEPETCINYIKENFPCFDNWDIIPAKEE